MTFLHGKRNIKKRQWRPWTQKLILFLAPESDNNMIAPQDYRENKYIKKGSTQIVIL